MISFAFEQIYQNEAFEKQFLLYLEDLKNFFKKTF